MSRLKIIGIILLVFVFLAGVGMQSVVAKPDVPPGFPCKTLYYVRSGDTLTSIAEIFDTPALVLIKINNIRDPALLLPGQELCVKYYTTAGTFYPVAPGDTLEEIADDFDQQPEFVSQVNELEDGIVYQGQILFIPRNMKFFK